MRSLFICLIWISEYVHWNYTFVKLRTQELVKTKNMHFRSQWWPSNSHTNKSSKQHCREKVVWDASCLLARLCYTQLTTFIVKYVVSRFRCGFRASTGIAAPDPTNHMFKQCEVKQNWFLIFGCNSCAYLFHLTSFTTSSQHRQTITPCPTPSTVCRCVATCFPQCHSIKSACKCVATPLHPTQPLQDIVATLKHSIL